jgi:hypothetical protein
MWNFRTLGTASIEAIDQIDQNSLLIPVAGGASV